MMIFRGIIRDLAISKKTILLYYSSHTFSSHTYTFIFEY